MNFYNLINKSLLCFIVIISLIFSNIIPCSSVSSFNTNNLDTVNLFFFNTNITFDIISNLMSSKTNTTSQSQKNKKNTNKKDNCTTQQNFIDTAFNSIVCLVSNISISFSEIQNNLFNTKIEQNIEYPLKIPFLNFIFLILLFKLIFNVLPRSISINYNIKNIERACIV